MRRRERRKAEEPYQNWSILYPTQKGDLKILEKFLLPKQELSLGVTSVLNYLLKPPKGKNSHYVAVFWLKINTLTKIFQIAYRYFTLEVSGMWISYAKGSTSSPAGLNLPI
jgi:hypothetical protein